MSHKSIKTEIHEGVGLIRINRPKALNALNSAVMEELGQALVVFDTDPQIGAIVITGDTRAFAAGADIKEMVDATAAEMLQSDPIKRWDLIREVKKPIIAAVS